MAIIIGQFPTNGGGGGGRPSGIEDSGTLLSVNAESSVIAHPGNSGAHSIPFSYQQKKHTQLM